MGQEQEQAIGVLIQAALLAQSKGIFSLDEAVAVKQAIDALKQKNTSTENKIINKQDV